MNNKPDALYLVRQYLDIRRLFTTLKSGKILPRQVDVGYLVHCYLTELFGPLKPQPFVITRTIGPWLEVLGYSQYDHHTLRKQAEKNPKKDLLSAVRWDNFFSKKMPDSFPAGKQLSFQLRICPVERKARGCVQHRPGAEIDVFLSVVERKQVIPSREEVYTEWIKKKLEETGAVKCLSLRLLGFRRSLFIRRDNLRRFKTLERPDAICQGRMEIKNSEAFQDLLGKGLGRHRCFGFGMLLLTRKRLL